MAAPRRVKLDKPGTSRGTSGGLRDLFKVLVVQHLYVGCGHGDQQREQTKIFHCLGYDVKGSREA